MILNTEPFYVLTGEQAAKVRFLRCGPITHSWRRIAEIMSAEHAELNVTAGDQCDGKDLCSAAAKFFGEDESEEPWN